MRIRSIVMPAFAAVVLLGTAARAEEGHRHGAAFRAACGQDVEKLCADAPKGKAVFECLKTHEAELSDSCKTFRAEHHRKAAEETPEK